MIQINEVLHSVNMIGGERMYILINALKNIVRNKGRYILVAIIMILMIVSITVSTMIHYTTNEVIDNYSERFGASVYFTADLKKVIKLPTNAAGNIEVPEITTDQLVSFSNSDYLKSTLFTGSMHTFSDSLQGLDQGGQEIDQSGAFVPSNNEANHSLNRQIPNSVVIGYSDLSLMDDFMMEQREISSGRMFETINECVISEAFAKLNSLEIDDTITVYNVDNISQLLTLKITGIYTDTTTEQSSGSTWAVNNRRNEILTNYETMIANGTKGVYTEATFYLKNPEYASQFEAEVKDKGFPDIYNVNTDADSYNQVVKPVKGLSKVSLTLMLIVLCFGLAVLILLSILLIRERRYEIGVLRVMGMKKVRVALGLIIESITIILVCLIIGFSIGVVVAQPISNAILQDQINIAKMSEINNAINNGAGVITNESNDVRDYSKLTQIQVVISPKIIILSVGIALFLGLISNGASIIYILKYEPMQILSERN